MVVGLDAISIEKVGKRSGTWTKGIERQTTSTEGVGHTQKRFVEQMNLPIVFACRQWIGVDSFPLVFSPFSYLTDGRMTSWAPIGHERVISLFRSRPPLNTFNLTVFRAAFPIVILDLLKQKIKRAAQSKYRLNLLEFRCFK